MNKRRVGIIRITDEDEANGFGAERVLAFFPGCTWDTWERPDIHATDFKIYHPRFLEVEEGQAIPYYTIDRDNRLFRSPEMFCSSREFYTEPSSIVPVCVVGGPFGGSIQYFPDGIPATWEVAEAIGANGAEIVDRGYPKVIEHKYIRRRLKQPAYVDSGSQFDVFPVMFWSGLSETECMPAYKRQLSEGFQE